jgi:hypothetical protein
MKELIDMVVYKTGAKGTDEFDALNDIDRTISRYERFTRNIMKSFDDSHLLHEYSKIENHNLLEENAKLRALYQSKKKEQSVEDLLEEKAHLAQYRYDSRSKEEITKVINQMKFN